MPFSFTWGKKAKKFQLWLILKENCVKSYWVEKLFFKLLAQFLIMNINLKVLPS